MEHEAMPLGVLIAVPQEYSKSINDVPWENPRSTASCVNNCAPGAPKAVNRLPDDQLRNYGTTFEEQSKKIRTPGEQT